MRKCNQQHSVACSIHIYINWHCIAPQRLTSVFSFLLQSRSDRRQDKTVGPCFVYHYLQIYFISTSTSLSSYLTTKSNKWMASAENFTVSKPHISPHLTSLKPRSPAPPPATQATAFLHCSAFISWLQATSLQQVTCP